MRQNTPPGRHFSWQSANASSVIHFSVAWLPMFSLLAPLFGCSESGCRPAWRFWRDPSQPSHSVLVTTGLNLIGEVRWPLPVWPWFLGRREESSAKVGLLWRGHSPGGSFFYG